MSIDLPTKRKLLVAEGAVTSTAAEAPGESPASPASLPPDLLCPDRMVAAMQQVEREAEDLERIGEYLAEAMEPKALVEDYRARVGRLRDAAAYLAWMHSGVHECEGCGAAKPCEGMGTDR